MSRLRDEIAAAKRRMEEQRILIENLEIKLQEQESYDLLPCPHCGNQPELVHFDWDDQPSCWTYEVVCQWCNLEHVEKWSAIEAWNRRATHDASRST